MYTVFLVLAVVATSLRCALSLFESLPANSTLEVKADTRPMVLFSVRKTATQHSALDVGRVAGGSVLRMIGVFTRSQLLCCLTTSRFQRTQAISSEVCPWSSTESTLYEETGKRQYIRMADSEDDPWAAIASVLIEVLY